MQTRHTVSVRYLMGLTAALLTAATALAGEINVGDPADKVREILGEPRGHIRSGTYELLQYDRGRVEVRDGVVTQVTLVSAEEAAAQKIEREQQYREAQARQAALREQRWQEGIANRDRALSNPDFLASSGTRQLQFWDDFRARYPDVPIAAEYTAALAKLDQERQEAETQQRLADMEQRVQEAEERAREAQRDAEEAERNANRRYVYASAPYYYYRPAPICPPPITNRTPNQPTYPVSSWGHNYTYWGTPHYVVQPSTISTPPPNIRTDGVRVDVRF